MSRQWPTLMWSKQRLSECQRLTVSSRESVRRSEGAWCSLRISRVCMVAAAGDEVVAGVELDSLTRLTGAEEHGGEDGCRMRSLLLFGHISQRISFLLSPVQRRTPNNKTL